MSINQYYCPSDFHEAHLWSQYIIQQSLQQTSSPPPPPPPPASTYSSFISTAKPEEEHEILISMTQVCNYNNNSSYGNEDEIPKLALFEKSLTPSDVGKLNRLVIPKQHAERYFPMKGAESIKDKGSLLSFEDGDDVAKTWRFRYSYWNSSQSYVLTKGWSRFVKEKKLEAGDIVLFFSHGVDAARLFIGWRRRSSGGGGKSQPAVGGGGGSNILLSSSSSGYPYPTHHQLTSSVQNQPHSLHTGSEVANQATAASSNCRRLRLFGVNLECQLDDDSEPSTPNGSPMSSQSEAHRHQYNYYSNYYNHTDNNLSGGEDVYRQG